MNIYRSEAPDKILGKTNPPKNTMRLPGNVPYLVDNLWEWKRPEGFPNRRLSVFASPSPELAQQLGRTGGCTYRVEICGEGKIAQLIGHDDSKWHPECKSLGKHLLQILGISSNDLYWQKASLAEKTSVGRLWLPGLTKEQIEQVFNSDRKLNVIRNDVYEMIEYWKDVRLLKSQADIATKGEIFFEAGNGYRLHPL